MAFSLTNGVAGPPTKFSYVDDETGDVKVSNVELGADGNPLSTGNTERDAIDNSNNNALGALPGESQDVNSLGNTNTNTEASGQTGLYGNSSIKSRSYTIKDGKPEEIPGISTIRSKSNAWTLLNYRAYSGGSVYGDVDYDQFNKTVIDAEKNNILNPTANRIVEYSSTNGGLGFSYNYRDFIQAEHYGQISNEFLVTLRRFAFPIGDDIRNTIGTDTEGKQVDRSEPDIARAITWLSPALGNEMKDILGFGTGFGWETIESEVQTATGADTQSRRGSRSGRRSA